MFQQFGFFCFFFVYYVSVFEFDGSYWDRNYLEKISIQKSNDSSEDLNGWKIE